MSLLYPEGVDHITDLPWTVHEAIRVGQIYLSFLENLPDDERPPREIWDDPEKLAAHKVEMDRKREEKYGGGRGDAAYDKPIDGPVERNAAARDLVVG